MRAAAHNFPEAIAPMIDTYEVKQGLTNVIKVADELKANGQQLTSIVVDSGDLLKIAKYARQKLDRAGHKKTKIAVSSNLDEYKIDRFLKAGMPADMFLLVTEIVTSADSPKLETVYKVAQIEDGGKVRYTAKFSLGKLSLPGKKQIYRKSFHGKIKKDIIGLEGENNLGQPLLVPIFKKGKLVYQLPTNNEQKDYVVEQLAQLPEKYKNIFKEYKPPLEISEKIKQLLELVRSRHIIN